MASRDLDRLLLEADEAVRESRIARARWRAMIEENRRRRMA